MSNPIINNNFRFIPISNFCRNPVHSSYGRKSSSTTEYLDMQEILEREYDPTLRIRKIAKNILQGSPTASEINEAIQQAEAIFQDANEEKYFSPIGNLPSSPRITPIDCRKECLTNIEELKRLRDSRSISRAEKEELVFEKVEVSKLNANENKVSSLGKALQKQKEKAVLQAQILRREASQRSS
jgi:hypothetical protein